MAQAVDGVNPLRARPALRRLLAPARLEPHSLVQVLLVKRTRAEAISSRLPAVAIDDIPVQAHEIAALGLGGVKLFAPEPMRTPDAIGAREPKSLCIQAVRAFKATEPDLCVMVETCLCSHTPTGACVIVTNENVLDRDATLERFSEMAVLQAQAGADVIAPAAMMEGTVRAVRQALDRLSFQSVSVMPHLEFRSALYRTYRRQAATGDGLHRAGLQIDVGHGDQALAAAHAMVREGADMILVEPGLFFLDVIHRIHQESRVPLGMFSVSGEHMLFAGADESCCEENVCEYYTSAVRAGVSCIVSYAAQDIAKYLRR